MADRVVGGGRCVVCGGGVVGHCSSVVLGQYSCGVVKGQCDVVVDQYDGVVVG